VTEHDEQLTHQHAADEITLELCPAADEPPVHAPELRAEVDEFSRALRSTGATFSQLIISLHAVDAFDYPSASFLITTLAPPALTAVAGIAGAWIHARAGRKIRLRVGAVQVEASTTKEIEQLLKSALILREEHKPEGKE
jgi:hypothetical protein